MREKFRTVRKWFEDKLGINDATDPGRRRFLQYSSTITAFTAVASVAPGILIIPEGVFLDEKKPAGKKPPIRRVRETGLTCQGGVAEKREHNYLSECRDLNGGLGDQPHWVADGDQTWGARDSEGNLVRAAGQACTSTDVTYGIHDIRTVSELDWEKWRSAEDVSCTMPANGGMKSR